MDNNQKALESLHTVLIQELLNRISTGYATPSDLNVARQLLKDNGIESIPVESSPFNDLMASLPDLETVHPLER